MYNHVASVLGRHDKADNDSCVWLEAGSTVPVLSLVARELGGR